YAGDYAKTGTVDGIGTLTVGGGLTWNSDTNFRFDLGASGLSDRLDLGTTMFDKGSGGNNFKFTFYDAGVTAGTYDLVKFGSTDFSVGDFSYDSSLNGLSGYFSLDSNNLYFTVTAVPEPSHLFFLVLIALFMVLRKFEIQKGWKVIFLMGLILNGASFLFAQELVFSDPLEESDILNLPPGLQSRKVGRKAVEFVEKEGKKCAFFRNSGKNDGGIAYLVPEFPVDEGSLEITILMEGSPGAFEKKIDIIGFHSSDASLSDGRFDINFFSLFFGGAGDWGNSCIFILREDKGKEAGIFTPNTNEWKAGEWHHMGMTWKVGANAKSEAALYIDHQLVKQSTASPVEWNRAAREQTKDHSILGPLWIAPPWGSPLGFYASQFKFYKGTKDFTVIAD
ncbi:MAG: hypothetical protein V4507_13525, partial [Verrucomicrobiota bacterium]